MRISIGNEKCRKRWPLHFSRSTLMWTILLFSIWSTLVDGWCLSTQSTSTSILQPFSSCPCLKQISLKKCMQNKLPLLEGRNRKFAVARHIKSSKWLSTIIAIIFVNFLTLLNSIFFARTYAQYLLAIKIASDVHAHIKPEDLWEHLEPLYKNLIVCFALLIYAPACKIWISPVSDGTYLNNLDMRKSPELSCL